MSKRRQTSIMAKVSYTVRATTNAHVAAKISKFHLHITNNQYIYDAATQFILGLKRMPKSICNPSSGAGMAQLLRSSTNDVNPSTISAIKSTNTATITGIIEE